MSEPMSRLEIEDVLSSIRRLVSEDLRPKTQALWVPEATDRPDGKLILTPALRVVPDAEPVKTGPAPAPISAVVAAVGAAVGRQDDTFEPVLGDAEPDAGWSPSNWDDVAQTLLFDGPGKTGGVAADADEGQAVAPEQDAAPQPEAEVAEDQTAEAGFVDDAPYDDPRRADAAEASVLEALTTQSDEAAATVMADVAQDADMLRSLVREMVREELAGPMGQRITRNVRKLVRSEIARALSVRDAE